MPTELLISPPATGKTTTCIQRIRATLADQPLAKVWVLVPDQLQVAAFKRRLAQAGGTLGVRVATFPFLYRQLLQSCGGDVPHASSSLVHRILQQVVNDAADSGKLEYFSPLQNMPGFIQSLREAFAELKNGMVKPEHFTAVADGAPLATRELAMLYAGFQEKVRSLGMADQEGYAWLAIKELEGNPSLAADIRLLVVDGFDAFTPAQHRALQLLTASVTHTIISLPGAVPFMRAAHRRYEKDGISLVERFGAPQAAALKEPSLPPDLLLLERNLFEVHSDRMIPAGQVELLEAQSPTEEAREALRWIKQRVIRDGLQPGNCAIFYPTSEEYRQGLKTCAAEFGIPIYFTSAEPLSQSTAVTAVLTMLDFPAGGYKARRLINLLRSPYFHLGEISEHADEMEKVWRAAQVVEGLDQWRDAWTRLANPLRDRQIEALDDEWRNPGLPREAEAARLADLTESLFEKLTPPDALQVATSWVTWLEDLLESTGFFEQVKDGPDQESAAALRDCLSALVQADVIAGKKPVDFNQFVNDLRGTLDGMGQRDSTSSGGSAVLAAAMTEARGMRFTAVAILGLSEGTFPAVEHSDPFLGEALRARLGLEPRLGRFQSSLFYQAVTRADKRLLLTRPYLSDKGEAQEPSAYWKDVAALFVKNSERRVRPDVPRAQADAGSRQELLFSAVSAGEPPLDEDLQGECWQSLMHTRMVLAARRARSARGRHEGQVTRLAGLLMDRFSAEHIWSASALEEFGSCPFRFYASAVLKLDAQSEPEPGMDAAQRGSIYHAILELTYHDAAHPERVEDLLSALMDAASRVFEVAPRKYGFRPSAVWEFEQEDILKKLTESIRAMAEETEWRPFAYEMPFGSHGAPALDLALDGESILLKGKIDRVDRNGGGMLRVVDYKTSGNYGNDDLEEGKKLQLPLYAMAVARLGLGQPADGIYWSISDAIVMRLSLAKFKSDMGEGLEAAEAVAVSHINRMVLEIRAGEFVPSRPEAGCPAYCPAVSWCWRYKKGY
jgi:ATP-dependent helicase/DNAse subunit B